MDFITGKTRLTGLLGRPVAHSISPLMHNAAFELLKLPYAYLCFDIGEEEMEAAVKGLKQLDARGWNCTMPDKKRMAELCDELSDAASIIGAVNTVVNEGGRLIGHNTDGVGYMMSVAAEGYDIRGGKMTLMGAGGAAIAIMTQAALDGMREITVFSRRGRSWKDAVTMAERINARTACRVSVYDYDDRERFRNEIRSSEILTNATSVGMVPNEDGCLLDSADMLKSGMIVSDIIYHPAKTRLLQMAEEAGCHTMNGMYMLLYQGAGAFRLWTGEDMPVEEIKRRYFL